MVPFRAGVLLKERTYNDKLFQMEKNELLLQELELIYQVKWKALEISHIWILKVPILKERKIIALLYCK